MDTALTDKGRQPPVGSRPRAADQQRDWRERGRERRQRLAELDDVFHAATFVMAELVARAVPERHWRAFGRTVAYASLAIRRHRAEKAAKLFDSLLAGYSLDSRALLASSVASSFEERVFFHKAAHDRAWRPDVRLEGREHLDAALAEGRGAVLWVAPATLSTLLVKIALHDAGYRVAHLSVQWHGLARTRFGRWLVNAHALSVEERFVERVIIPAGGRAGDVLEEFGRRLCRNEVVTITAVGNANRPVEVPFLGGHLQLGPGAPRLALAHRVPLLAAITTRDGDGAFRVALERLTADAGGADGNGIEHLAHAFAEAYARGVVESPALWKFQSGWRAD